MRPTSNLARALLVATLLGSACYTHVARPGLVRVVEYELADRVEVTCTDLQVRSDDRRSWWLELSAEREGADCTPVAVRLYDVNAPGLAAGDIGESLEFLGAGRAQRIGGAWHLDPAHLASWVRRQQPTIIVGDIRLVMRDEHMFNLQGFVEELGCPTLPAR